MLEIEEKKCWTCRDPECQAKHETRAEAEACFDPTDIEQISWYVCPICRDEYLDKGMAQRCCDIGAAQERLEIAKGLVTKMQGNPGLYALALQAVRKAERNLEDVRDAHAQHETEREKGC